MKNDKKPAKKTLVISTTDTAKLKKKLGAADLGKVHGGSSLPTPND